MSIRLRHASGRLSRAGAWLARFTGPFLIVLISASCGFVIGVAVATAPSSP